MRITKKVEGDLIDHLQKRTVSAPAIQDAMNVSYKDARSLIEYALGRKWIKGCGSGNEYTVIVSDFAPKDLPEDICQTICKDLGYDAFNVLCYLGKRFGATFAEILEDVDDDEDDMQNAVNALLDLKLIFRHEVHYYCRISKQSVAQMEEIKKKANRTTTRPPFRHLFNADSSEE